MDTLGSEHPIPRAEQSVERDPIRLPLARRHRGSTRLRKSDPRAACARNFVTAGNETAKRWGV